MAQVSPYVSQQAILQEAGLWQRKVGETASGNADGNNRVFTTTYKPLADTNYDDVVDTDDVTLYDDGAPVSIVSVDETSGAITAVTAPANGSAMTVDYASSPISSDAVAQVIDEAQELVDDVMGQVVTTPYTTVPKTVRKIVRFYAAGLLMSREYGLQMTDESGKEGAKKIKQAEDWLTAYRQRIEDNGADIGAVAVPTSSTDRRLFQTYDSETGTWNPNSDENFSLNEAS